MSDEEILRIEEQLSQPVKYRQEDQKFAEQARRWLALLIEDVKILRGENRQLHEDVRVLDAWIREIGQVVAPGKRWLTPGEIKESVADGAEELRGLREESARFANLGNLRGRVGQLQVNALDIAGLRDILQQVSTVLAPPPGTAIERVDE